MSRRDKSRHRRSERSPTPSEPDGPPIVDDYPRRRTRVQPAEPAAPKGYRTSRRSSKSGKRMRRVAKEARVRAELDERVRDARAAAARTAKRAAITLGVLGIAVAVLVGLASAINLGARWLAEREAVRQASPEGIKERARDNLLLVGLNDSAGPDFLALRLDEATGQIFGIAIPAGAFMEVPGQGFERVGDSYAAGPDVSLAAVSNYLSVPFENYAAIDREVYQAALTGQSLRGVLSRVVATDLDDEELGRITAYLDSVPTSKVALVPLPVKPISLGTQTYFEPQRDQIADLLLQWWGVKLGAEQSMTRAIVYNGAGTPGIAGEAAQFLIRAGVRVIETANADRFDYEETLIVVQGGDVSHAEMVRSILGVGRVVQQPSDQEVADVIIIIGRDYVPPAGAEP